MKNPLIFLFFLIFVNSIFSQTVSKTKMSYSQFDITVAFRGNTNSNEFNNTSEENEKWFLPDGLGAKFGYGFHHKKWVALGIHSGINWEWTDKLVVVPVFANLKLSPKVGDQTRIVLQTGLGKVFALGRGNLMGDYKKMSLGLQSDDILLFVEIADYDFEINQKKEFGNISLGISLMSF